MITKYYHIQVLVGIGTSIWCLFQRSVGKMLWRLMSEFTKNIVVKSLKVLMGESYF